MDKIEIRATQLEKYITCPFKYKNDLPIDGDAEHFRFWTALHKYIELRLVNLINETTEQMIFKDRWVKQRLMMIKMANLFEAKVQEKGYTLICSEWTNEHFFEDLNIKLSWTFDHLFINKEWEYILVDAKTASSKRSKEMRTSVRQNVIYPALVKLKYWLDIKYFEYWVMTKKSNPSLEDICFEITGDPVEDIYTFVKELRESNTQNFFPPKYPNYSCWFCKLYDQCKNFTW